MGARAGGWGGVQLGKMRKFGTRTVGTVAPPCEGAECRGAVHLNAGRTIKFMLCVCYHN